MSSTNEIIAVGLIVTLMASVAPGSSVKRLIGCRVIVGAGLHLRLPLKVTDPPRPPPRPPPRIICSGCIVIVSFLRINTLTTVSGISVLLNAFLSPSKAK